MKKRKASSKTTKSRNGFVRWIHTVVDDLQRQLMTRLIVALGLALVVWGLTAGSESATYTIKLGDANATMKIERPTK